VRIGAVTSLIAIALQSLMEFSLQMPGNAALFAVVAALAVHEGAPEPERRHHSGANRLRQGYGGPPKLYAKAEAPRPQRSARTRR
jgi:hypothetical protein